MGLDGEWKPPQDWPESTPPLPGWVRGPDGRWTDAPVVDDITVVDSEDDITVVDDDIEVIDDGRAAQDDVPPTKPKSPGLGLTYSTEPVAVPMANDADGRMPRRALIAAVSAAVIAVMLGTGIVLLILL